MDQKIIDLIKEKGSSAIDAFNASKEVFDMFRKSIQLYESEIKSKMAGVDSRILVDFDDKGKMELHLRVANDELVYLMQTSIFNFDNSHPMFKTSYIKDDNSRSTCGMICIYNFLTDSFKFNRQYDSGFLVARIFVNKEKHFWMEGKKQIGLLFNNFQDDVIDDEKIKTIIEKILFYCLEIDLIAPPYDLMQQATVMDLLNRSGQVFENSKRFGFYMQSDKTNVS